MIYFTSDCHFYCSNILKYQPERYKFGNNLKIINKNLINRQNNQVDKNDIVYVVGDFIQANDIKQTIKVINKLNGKIYLLKGNHDNQFNRNHHEILTNKFYVIHDIEEVILSSNMYLYLFHYPLHEQPNYHKNNTFHLYGHLHGDYKFDNSRAIDISYNIYDFKLLSHTKIISYFNNI